MKNKKDYSNVGNFVEYDEPEKKPLLSLNNSSGQAKKEEMREMIPLVYFNSFIVKS